MLRDVRVQAGRVRQAEQLGEAGGRSALGWLLDRGLPSAAAPGVATQPHDFQPQGELSIGEEGRGEET